MIFFFWICWFLWSGCGALPQDPFGLDDVVLLRSPLELVEEVLQCFVVGVGVPVPVVPSDLLPVTVELTEEGDDFECCL